MISEALYALLVAIGGFQVFPWPAPANRNPPHVTYQRDSERTGSTFDGDDCLATAEFDVSCWSPEYLEAQQLAKGIRTALRNYSGTSAGVRVQRVHLVNQIDQFDWDEKLHRAMLQFKITYEEG